MIESKYNNQTSNVLSTLLILLGSLMLGFIVTRSIFVYQKYNSPLDTVDLEVEQPVPLQDLPQMVLDVSTPLNLTLNQDAEKVVRQVRSYVETQYNGDNGEMEDFFRRVPKKVTIPSIGLDSEIEFANIREVNVLGETYEQWVAPLELVGWHYRSGLPGEAGNTVLNGHHNVGGEVFKDLVEVQKGDEIILSSDSGKFYYKVATVMILPERFETREIRLQNARWIQQSEDERITLITCWPYDSNTHRVIVVAFPTDKPTD